MPEGKKKFIEDAALVIDGRVAALKAELERHRKEMPKAVTIGDRAAILEAELCAGLIRTLLRDPYRGDPYKVARERWSKGEAKETGE